MHPNQALIEKFYTAFQNRDAQEMKECYGKEVVFNDAAFTNLNYEEVSKMWEMLIKRGKDLELDFEVLEVDDHKGKAKWIPTYTFSQTKRKVVNHIEANFKFKDGKIIQHDDQFDFYRWSRQAFGLTGALLGWTSFFHNKVREKAMASLKKYMAKG